MNGEESVADGGLAPVIPIFGDHRRSPYPTTAAAARQVLEDRLLAGRRDSEHRRGGGGGDALTYPGGSGTGAEHAGSRSPTSSVAEPDHPVDLSAAGATDAAERGLMKRLRGRQLSVTEARAFLVQHDLEADAVDAIVDAFIERGYLDDARLAEQLVHAGVDRKGQGRQAIARTLAQRGVPRDVADAALSALPDDDAERALDFARTKAGSLRGLEPDVALRRLAGQLARRGYRGSLALNAARQALDESARPETGVRFE